MKFIKNTVFDYIIHYISYIMTCIIYLEMYVQIIIYTFIELFTIREQY